MNETALLLLNFGKAVTGAHHAGGCDFKTH
jgi:hypothetical protein